MKHTLNLNILGLGPSATLAINERSNALLRQGREVYKLGLGQSPFPVPHCVVEALKENAHQKDYQPVRGLEPLREAVAEFHRKKDGLDCSAADVLIGPGSKELMFLLQLVYYGELVIPNPSWVSYAPQAQIIGRPVRWVLTRPEADWCLSGQDLERICQENPDKPRLLILNYPNNPVGNCYSDEMLEEIAGVARKYGVVVLADEVYSLMHHGAEPTSIARFYPEGTIVSSGLSKWCGAGGWRLGTFVFPKKLRVLLDALAVAASETFTSTSAPIQYAAICAFKGGPEIDRYLSLSRRLVTALTGYFYEQLVGAGCTLSRPQGGFYLFPSFAHISKQLNDSGIHTSNDLAENLLDDTGVATLGGSHFGVPEHKFNLRLAIVNFDGGKALAAIDGLADDAILDESFLREHCSDVVRASELIVKWVEAVRTGGERRVG